MPYNDSNRRDPPLSRQEIDAAKKVDLYSWLMATNPNRLVPKRGGDYCLADNFYIAISKNNGKWNYIGAGYGGVTALEFLMKVDGMKFIDAVNAINGKHLNIGFDVGESRSHPVKRPFELPPANQSCDHVRAYLAKRRIPSEIISHCIGAGLLYESVFEGKYGRLYNCVFVGKDNAGVPRSASIRSTGGDYRIDVPGGDKRHAFRLNGTDESVLYITESAIDALSIAALFAMSGRDWRTVSVQALCGVYDKRKDGRFTPPLSVEQYLKDHPATKRIFVCTDADTPGRTAASALKELYLGYEVIDAPPPAGKDYNDFLQYRCRSERRAASSIQHTGR